MQGFFKRIFGNLKILIIALILAVGLFFIIKNPELFRASVLLLEDKQTIEANQRDIGYKNSDNLLDVFIAEQLAEFETLDFVVTMDPDTIVVDFSQIEAQLNFEILDQSAEGFSIRLTSSTGVDYSQSLFMVPFVGDEPYILLSEGLSKNEDGDSQPLAIGNLDEDKQSHQK